MQNLSTLAKFLAIATGILVLFACSKPQPALYEASLKADVSVFQTYSAEEFFKTRSVFGSSLNVDATAVLVSDDASGIYNAYKVPLDGSESIQLTHSSKESIYVVS